MIYFLTVYALEISTDSIKITQLTDLHYGEGDTQDSLNSKACSNQLSWEDPDLVVITGDLVSGYAWPSTSGWFNESYQKFIKTLKQHKKPWALILGNHDIEADLTGDQILELDSSEALSLSCKEISSLSHSSNYYIPITHNGVLELIIWALDTGNRNHLEFGFDKVHRDQLDWIKATQKAMKIASGKDVPGIVFVHIPPPEFMDLWPTAKGHRFEDVACPGDHKRYVVESLENIIAFAAGHDHFNDYEGLVSGITLYYGRKTGYAGVGPEPYFNKGARVFSYNFNTKKLDSWIREETGEKVVLNERTGLMNKQEICAESQDSRQYFFYLFGVLVLIPIYFCVRKNEKPVRLKL